MSMPILTTKLYIPPLRPELVSRPRLIERLNEGLLQKHGFSRKLTLIAAPAGFGKTTLVSAWAADCGRPVAWLALDEGDSDPARFLLYVVTALQTLDPEVGLAVLDVIQSPQPPPYETLLITLLNDITTTANEFILVLDDYHLVDAEPVDRALTFLLENLPPQMHVVITTREDPSLPLARYRARGQSTELRARDLRFTSEEASQFLNRVMSLDLSAEAIEALEKRTEGWIAGLQLAALSMLGHQDTDSFITSFTGTHHYVLDYLVEEVLEQQPERIQSFLLTTAILDRLTGPLCDALTGQTDGQQTLEHLERANLFLIPLDNERRWYRYHHLFADLLRQRLHQSADSSPGEEGGIIAQSHLQASRWFEANGLEVEAFQHAAAANDIRRAERLMEGEGMPLYFRGAMGPVLNWLESLPAAVMEANPSLWVSYASALTIIGQQIDNVEEHLQAAEAALQSAEPDTMTRDLLGQIAATRAMLAIPRQQIDTIITQSHRALEYLHPDNLPMRTAAMWTLGYAYQLQGNRGAAKQAYTEIIPMSEASGNIMITIGALVSLGQVLEADNELHLAAETYRRIFSLAGDPPLPGASEAHFGLARIYYQWNDLEAAQQHADASLPLAQQMENVDSPGNIWMFLSRLRLAQGDVSGAIAALDDAEQFITQRSFTHRLSDVAATRVAILLHQGDLDAATDLAEAHDLPISRARVHLAQGSPSAALSALGPLRQQVEEHRQPDERLKLMVLQAVAYHALGEMDTARLLLEEALTLAAPEGFIRLFVDEGPPMAQILSEAAARGIMPDYTRRLLAAFTAEASGSEDNSLPHAQPLIEPLSERELEVLALIIQGFSNREIGERLFIALDTVKGHNRRIYAKLGVKRRTEAVARARELSLL